MNRGRTTTLVAAAVGLLAVSGLAKAGTFDLSTQPLLMQIGNPANAGKSVQGEYTPPTTNYTLTAAAPARVRSYEAPAITVAGENPDGLVSEDRIGSYGQPRWTATRRFPNTRVYVIPEGKVEFEYWVRPTFENDGNTETRTLYELEFGLPYRFQLDLYLRSDQGRDTGDSSGPTSSNCVTRWPTGASSRATRRSISSILIRKTKPMYSSLNYCSAASLLRAGTGA